MSKKFPIRVQDAIEECFSRTKPVRQVRQRMLKQYANGFYSGGQSAQRRPMPLNIIDRGVQIIAPFLVTNDPRVLIKTRYGASKKGLKSFATTLELALTHLFGEIKLAQRTLRPLVIDSLFAMGITKTGVWTAGTVDMGGWLADVGQPYCDRVDFNDYFFDVFARNREELAFEGNRYRLPLQFVRDSGLFKNYDSVVPDLSQQKDVDPKTIVDDNDEVEYTELREMVELQDVYLPDEGTVITLPLRGYGNKIMRTVEWEGPEDGPYDILMYKNYPESVIPIAPVYTWLDISKTLNIMVRKMAENCEREKSIGVYQAGEEEDAGRWKDAKHGDVIGLQNPGSAKEITIGGFEPKSMEFAQYLEHQFAISYSNLYGIGGKGAQAKTLGQEQMMQYNATRALDDMEEQFHNFTRSIIKKLAFFLWTDPTKQIPMIRNVGGMDIEVTYSKDAQEGDFVDYSFDIDPYSLSRMSPELRQQKMMELISGVILPLAPLAMQQGSYPDVDVIVKEMGRYMHIPDLETWWKSAVPQEGTNPHELTQGAPSQPKAPGQMNDRFGASPASKSANSRRAQTSGQSSKPSPSNK